MLTVDFQGFKHIPGRELLHMSKSLNLNALNNVSVTSYDKEVSIFENVDLIVQLPDDSKHEMQYPIGESLATVKKRVCDEFGFAFDDVALYLNGDAFLMDPLSLNDVPAIVQAKGSKILIVLKKK